MVHLELFRLFLQRSLYQLKAQEITIWEIKRSQTISSQLKKTHYNLHTDANVEHRWDNFFSRVNGVRYQKMNYSVDTSYLKEKCLLTVILFITFGDKDFFRLHNVLPFSCTHLYLCIKAKRPRVYPRIYKQKVVLVQNSLFRYTYGEHHNIFWVL